MFDDVVEVRDRLAVLVDRLDPDAFSGSAARELWQVFDAAERLCAAGKTLLARRVAETHRPDRSGTRSAAEELANKAGTSAGAAKDAMDTSQRLPGQPELDKAIRRGELSPAQAGLISSAAAANPAAERRLTELASQVSLAELREECARVRAAADPDPEATNRRLHAGRRLRRWTDSEGFWNLHAKGSPQAGALFNTVLDPIIDRIFKTASRAGRREHPDAYAFDALIHLAEHATGHCDCAHPTQSAGDAGDGDADTTEAARADAAGADCGGTDADAADTAGTETAGRDEAAQADAAGAGAAGAGADGVGADGVGADAGLDGAASRAAAAEPATASGEQQTPGPAGRTGQGADGDHEPGTATVGDPGIFAANAGATGSAGQSGSGFAVRPSTNPRYLALLRVDAAALRRGHIAGEELCEIAGVGPVPVSVARDLLGEAIVKLVITNGVDVANVTHLGRGPTTAQKIALLWTNPRCSVQGCDRRRIEYDHQKPWAQTRHTRLDELDPLCGFHHDLKTRLHWALVPGTGKRAFVAPDDPRHPRNQNRANAGTRQSADAGRTPPSEPPTQRRRPRTTGTAEDARPPTVPGPGSPPGNQPGKAAPPRTARRAASAQMTLPEPPAEQAPHPP